MANPSFSDIITIYGNTNYINANTTASTVVAGETNKVKKITSILAANYGTGDQTVSVWTVRSSNNYYIANQITVPTKATVLIIGREHGFYLLENDTLTGLASTANSVTITVAYEVLSI